MVISSRYTQSMTTMELMFILFLAFSKALSICFQHIFANAKHFIRLHKIFFFEMAPLITGIKRCLFFHKFPQEMAFLAHSDF